MTTNRPNQDDRNEMRENGIVCPVCLYYGLGHDGEHVAPANGAAAVMSALGERAS